MIKRNSQEKESWAFIENTAKLFQISSLGNVRRFDVKLNRWVDSKSFNNSRGYLEVGINFLDKRKACPIARLVAENFVPNDDPENKKYVVHLDGDKKNNHYLNLKWVTNGEALKRTHWKSQESRTQTLELMRQKAIEQAEELANNSGWQKEKKEIIANLNPNVETWAFLPDTDKKYSVSSFGRVKSHVSSQKGVLRKLGADKKTGSLKVELSVGKKKSKVMVHRLVAEVFVENNDPINKDMVIHIDGNKANNHAENLKWIDKEEWREYNRKRFRMEDNKEVPIKRGNTHLNMESARLIRKLASEGVQTTKLAKLFRITPMQVLRIRKNECWKEDENEIITENGIK